MAFFCDYILPWILLYFVVQLLMAPGKILRFMIDPPRYDR